MERSFRSTVLVLLLLLGHNIYAQKSEEKQVRKSFEAYKAAILNDKGEEAIRYVDSRTIKYYSDILLLVRTADSATVETLSIMDKLMVLSVRHRTVREDILHFDGQALLVHAIKSGMVGKNSVANNSIGEVQVDNDFAKGRFLSNGQETPMYFHFYKEEGQWKFDLTSLFSLSTLAFQKMADESGQEENDYLFSLLEMLTGKRPGAEVWQPVR